MGNKNGNCRTSSAMDTIFRKSHEIQTKQSSVVVMIFSETVWAGFLGIQKQSFGLLDLKCGQANWGILNIQTFYFDYFYLIIDMVNF